MAGGSSTGAATDGDGPLLAKKLDSEGLVNIPVVREYLEGNGDRILYYSQSVTEVVPGSLSIKRVFAVSDAAIYKFPVTALETGIFTSTRFPLSDLKEAIITGLTVKLIWRREPKGADHVLQFPELQQRKEFLLTLCHLLPDVPITPDRDNEPQGGVSPAEDDIHGDAVRAPDMLASYTDRKHMRPIPPRPSPPALDPPAAAPEWRSITGDLTLDEMQGMVHLLYGTLPTKADKLVEEEVEDDLPIASPPQAVGSASVQAAHYSPFSPERARSIGLSPDGRPPPPIDFMYPVPLEDVDSPLPRRLHDASKTSPPYRAGGGVHLNPGDTVEVRDRDTDPWQTGTVRGIKGDDNLTLDADGYFLEFTSPSTQVTVQPQGTDKAFSWRQLRVPTRKEQQRREDERMRVADSERKLVEEDEEKRQIRELIEGMERRLEQGLREISQEQQVASNRITARQRADDPRILAIRDKLLTRTRGPSKQRLHQQELRGGADVPHDRVLLGENTYRRYVKWRKTGGLTEGSGEWTMDDTKQLIAQLRQVLTNLERHSALPEHVARVLRVLGFVDRERQMFVNKSTEMPVMGQAGRVGRKPTVPTPFKLSKGTKPPVLMGPAEFQRELRQAALKSQRELEAIRLAHAKARDSLSPPRV